jgi:geranylgeranyl reductase family protein
VDVAIVGAGPAGTWAAYSLARQGARVTIFDASHPREKPCGGGVTGRALALVADAVRGIDYRATVIRSARFVDSRRQQSAVVPLDHRGLSADTALLVASRAAFDAALLAAAEQAGATLERTRVTDVTIAADGVWLATTSGARRAGFVIGADGTNSLVRRRAAQSFRRDQLSIATGVFAHGVTGDEIVVEMVGDPPGYLWSFPRPDHLAVGICAPADTRVTAETLRARTLEWMRTIGIGDGARLQAYSWPIPSLSASDFAALSVSGPRWCLVGDAAGLVDPITREGIYFALASGQWAADALRSGGRGDLYASHIRDEAVPELARAARVKAWFFRAASSGLMIRALQQSAGIGAVMADLVAGRQSYAELKWRLLRTFEWRLAARALLEK